MIPCDGWFFTLFRYEISHITYRKVDTGISNKLAPQHERTIVQDSKPSVILPSDISIDAHVNTS